MPGPTDNLISVAIQIDASQLATGMDRMKNDVQSSLNDLKNAFKQANLEMKLIPKTDPAMREEFQAYKSALEQQVASTQLNLARISVAWEKAAAQVREAQAVLNAPLQRGDDGRFLPRETGGGAYQAAQQQMQAAVAEQESLMQRMAALQVSATGAAARPGGGHPNDRRAELDARVAEERQAAAEIMAFAEEEEAKKQAAIRETTAVAKEADEIRIVDYQAIDAAKRKQRAEEKAALEAQQAPTAATDPTENAAVVEAAEARKQAAVEKTAEVSTAASTAQLEAQKALQQGLELTAEQQQALLGRTASAEQQAASQSVTAKTEVSAAATAQAAAEEKSAQAAQSTLIRLDQQITLTGRLAQQKLALRQAEIEVRNAAEGLTEVEARFGQMAAAGNTNATATLEQYKAELNSAAAAQIELEETVLQTEQAIQKLGEAGEGAGTKLTGSLLKAQMAGQVLRETVGIGIPRAMERVISQSPLMEKALEMAMPIFTATMMAEILTRIVEKVLEWRDGVKDIKDYEETIGKDLDEQGKKYAELVKQQREANFKLIGARDGRAAEDKARGLYDNQQAAQDQTNLKVAEDKLKATQARILEIRKMLADHPVESGPVNPYTGGAGQAASETPALQKARDEWGNGSRYSPIYKQLAQDEANLNVAREKTKLEQTESAEKAAEAEKAAAKEGTAAMRAKSAALRDADSDALADLKANHEVTIQEEIAFWEKRLATEGRYAERYKEIKRTLGSLHQQKDRQDERSKISGEDETASGMNRPDDSADNPARLDYWNRIASEAEHGSEEFANAVKKATTVGREAIKQADDDLVKDDAQAFEKLKADHAVTARDEAQFWADILRHAKEGSKEYEAATKQLAGLQGKLRQEQLAQSLGQQNAAHTVAQGGFEQRQDQIQFQYKMSDGSPAAERAELQALKQLHQEEEQEELQHLARMAVLASNGGDQKKSEESWQQYVQKVQQYNRTIEKDNQALTLQMEQQWKRFFSQINGEFTQAVNGWMSGQEKFSTGMEKMWDQMVTTFVDNLIKMGLQWAEQELLMTVLHVTGVTTRLAADEAAHATKKVQAAEEAFWGGFNSVIDIPIIGPVLAPIVGAGAAAAVMAFEQGGFVPNTPGGVPAMLHANEMVLPAQYAQPFKSMIDAGSTTPTSASQNGQPQAASGNAVMVTNFPTVQQVTMSNANSSTSGAGQTLADRLAVAVGGPASDIKDSIQTMTGLFGSGGPIDGSTAARALYVKIVKPGGMLGSLGNMIPGLSLPSLPFFEDGGIVPATNLAMLHKNEMVLPAHLSSGMQSLIAGGGGGGGGNTHIHYSPTVHSYGAGGMESMLKEHASTIHGIVKTGMKRGHLPSI